MPDPNPTDGPRFVAALPPALARQQAVLLRLLDAVKAWPEAHWLVLSCSIARGAADAHSDIDLGLGLAEDAMPAALDNLMAFLRQGGEVLDALEHRLPRFEPRPHRHVFVQYAGGVQVDITAAGASYLSGCPAGEVVLYDAEHALTAPHHKAALDITGERVREWAFLGWWALGDLAKYLARGSLWEARQRLTEATEQVFRLWGVARGVTDAAYGLVAVVDRPDVGMPAGIERTVVGLDAGELLGAARRVAELLERCGRQAADVVPAELPTALAAHVQARLRNPAV
ncbi:hypothetical protein [Flindersiella endophytica]